MYLHINVKILPFFSEMVKNMLFIDKKYTHNLKYVYNQIFLRK